jgi:RNA polymerase sigma-70 factor (ECF subfamily)
MMSDGELVRQTLAGQTQAYEELVRRWTGRVLALCHARLGHADSAEDLAQETLLRGFRNLRSLTEPEKFGAWLCGIATHACQDWLRAKERRQIPFSVLRPDGDPEELFPPPAGPDRVAEDRAEELGQLMAEVEALPAEYREVLMLYYYEDVTYRDLAELLGVSPATINARLTKARARLRARLSAKIGR